MLQERDFMPVRARVRSNVPISRAGAFRGAGPFLQSRGISGCSETALICQNLSENLQ